MKDKKVTPNIKLDVVGNTVYLRVKPNSCDTPYTINFQRECTCSMEAHLTMYYLKNALKYYVIE